MGDYEAEITEIISKIKEKVGDGAVSHSALREMRKKGAQLSEVFEELQREVKCRNAQKSKRAPPIVNCVLWTTSTCCSLCQTPRPVLRRIQEPEHEVWTEPTIIVVVPPKLH